MSHLILVAGDFNVRSFFWREKDREISEGSQIDAITSSYGLSELICEPTYIYIYQLKLFFHG